MADRPLSALGGKTPLQAAFTPNMDKLAREGAVGEAKTLPEGLPTGSDVANLGILGYDPARYYTGRAPLEAASMGLRLKSGDVAFRCNFVTLKFNKDRTRAFMEDHSAGQLTSEEGRMLMKDLNRELGSERVKFYPGVSYRNLMLYSGGNSSGGKKVSMDMSSPAPGSLECTPPHDILGREISGYLPQGAGEDIIRKLMLASVDILERHSVNRKRVAAGKRPANSIWLWGQGGKPELPPFGRLYGLKGAMVSAVDLAKGLAISAGLKVVEVPGATGYLDTNYAGKAEYALRALDDADFVYIHVEAPDETSHEGSIENKIKAIEDFDALVVGGIMRGMPEFGRFRVLLMPDHATPIELRTHAKDPVPFAIYDSAEKAAPVNADRYDESILKLSGILKLPAHEIMKFFLNPSPPAILRAGQGPRGPKGEGFNKNKIARGATRKRRGGTREK